MAINWEKLELDIKTYLESGKDDLSRTRKQAAKGIETLYLTEIQIGATDIFLNPVLSLTITETTGLHRSLENGFNNSFDTGENIVLNQTGMSGAIEHWTGAQMSFAIPAIPAMATGLNNSVSVAGSIFPMTLTTTSETQDLFAKELIIALKSHATTIQGLFSGITPAGTGIVVPWVGIL